MSNLSRKYCTFSIRSQEPNKLPPWVVSFILSDKMNLRWVKDRSWGDFTYENGMKFNWDCREGHWLLTYLECDDSIGVVNDCFVPYVSEFKTDINDIPFVCKVYELIDNIVPLCDVINLNSVGLVNKVVSDKVNDFIDNKSRMAEVVLNGEQMDIKYWDTLKTPTMVDGEYVNFICRNIFRTFMTVVNGKGYVYAYNFAANRLIIGESEFEIDKPTHLPSDEPVE